MPSWIQDPQTGKLIPKEEYRRGMPLGPRIQPDIDAFISPVDGKPIYSRRQLREHNARHGVTNVADYGESWFERKASERAAELKCESSRSRRDRIEAIQRALARHESK